MIKEMHCIKLLLFKFVSDSFKVLKNWVLEEWGNLVIPISYFIHPFSPKLTVKTFFLVQRNYVIWSPFVRWQSWDTLPWLKRFVCIFPKKWGKNRDENGIFGMGFFYQKSFSNINDVALKPNTAVLVWLKYHHHLNLILGEKCWQWHW